MPSNDDGILPARDRPRDSLEDDGLTENRPAQDISNRPVGAPPHLLEIELLHAGFVGSDGRAFYADVVFENGLS